MFNLYSNAIDTNGFINLVSKKRITKSSNYQNNNRKIISLFAVASLMVITLINSGVEFQNAVYYVV